MHRELEPDIRVVFYELRLFEGYDEGSMDTWKTALNFADAIGRRLQAYYPEYYVEVDVEKGVGYTRYICKDGVDEQEVRDFVQFCSDDLLEEPEYWAVFKEGEDEQPSDTDA